MRNAVLSTLAHGPQLVQWYEAMKVLYCGDDEFAALYVKGALEELEHVVAHVAVEQVFPREIAADIVILSDYPAKQIDTDAVHRLMRFVKGGGRLVMLGGWASFNGTGRNYFGHGVASLLPVGLERGDDRQNVPQGLIIGRGDDLADIFDCDWNHPPVICGYNLIQSKAAAEELVVMRPIITDETTIELGAPLPLVVAQDMGKGRVVCCMTDLAPHWCGGLVDWGDARVTLSTGKEVGSDYVAFMDLITAG